MLNFHYMQLKFYLSCIEMDSNITLARPRIVFLKLVELLNCEYRKYVGKEGSIGVYEIITACAIVK